MSLLSDIRAIEYRREGSTGNMVGSFNGVEVVLVANRSGMPQFKNITSYGAKVDGRRVGSSGSLRDAKVFVGMELLAMFEESAAMPDCSPAGEPC